MTWEDRSRGRSRGQTPSVGEEPSPEDLGTPRFILFLSLACCVMWGKSLLPGLGVPVGEMAWDSISFRPSNSEILSGLWQERTVMPEITRE